MNEEDEDAFTKTVRRGDGEPLHDSDVLASTGAYPSSHQTADTNRTLLDNTRGNQSAGIEARTKAKTEKVKHVKHCLRCGNLFSLKGRPDTAAYCSKFCSNNHRAVINPRSVNTKTLQCPCGEIFTFLPYKRREAKYCSRKCLAKFRTPRESHEIAKKCLGCGGGFKVANHRIETAKYCSKRCADEHRQITQACKQCGEIYTVKRSRKDKTLFCSRSCHLLSNRNNRPEPEKTTLYCKVCAKPIIKPAHLARRGLGKTCSKKCNAKNLSLNFSGENSPKYVKHIEAVCEWCGKSRFLSPCFAKGARFCGKPCRNEWQSKRMSGEDSPNWKGGKSSWRKSLMASREYKEWRGKVFARDSYTCQRCGDSKGGNLNAHHIQHVAHYPDLVLVVENGITLCEDCHVETHKRHS
jgi:hypothetical protein